MSAGKGSKQRPTNYKQFKNNFDDIKFTKKATSDEFVAKKGKLTKKY